jgi:hypothetical protein
VNGTSGTSGSSGTSAFASTSAALTLAGTAGFTLQEGQTQMPDTTGLQPFGWVRVTIGAQEYYLPAWISTG